MADQTYLQQTQTILPEYQEAFLKSLLTSVYNPEDRTGLVTTSPLSQVAPPTLVGFTPAQQEAIRMGVSGIGAYQPMFEAGARTLGQGLGAYTEGVDLSRLGAAALGGTAAAYRPESYRPYYDPFVEEVIQTTQQDLQRAADIERNRLSAEAVGAGAYGGSRQAVAEQELARNLSQQQAQVGAQLRSQAYQQAQQQAQTAFQNQMARGQSASQIFGQLGQGIGSLAAGMGDVGVRQVALGEAAQAARQRDVNALFNLGSTEQAQMQAEVDVQRQAQQEAAYEPYQRVAFMSDIFRGVPSSSGVLTAATRPSPSPISSILGTAIGLQGMQQGTGTGLLSGLLNPSGV